MPVLDTNFLIALEARDPSAVALLQKMRGDLLLVPSIVAAEFLMPFGGESEAAFGRLKEAFTIAHTTDPWVAAAVSQRRRVQDARRSIRLADAWISIWAALHQTYVVTRNVRDFEAQGIPAVAW